MFFNIIKTKHLIIIITITIYFLKNFLREYLVNIKERFSNKINNLDFSNKINSKKNIQQNSKKKINNKNDTILYSNKESQDNKTGCNYDIYDDEFEYSTDEHSIRNYIGCSKKKKNDILVPDSIIPYNYSNNSNNSILYTISPNYTKKKINYEKELSEGVAACNSKLLSKNFDKNIDSYKINKYKYVTKKREECFVNDPIKFKKELKLFSRIKNDTILINCNIPLLQTGYYPHKIYLLLSNKSKNDLKIKNKSNNVFELPICNNTSSFSNEIFNLDTFLHFDRISYFIKTPKKLWNTKNTKSNMYSKIIFIFKYYHKYKLNYCYMESNISSLLYSNHKS